MISPGKPMILVPLLTQDTRVFVDFLTQVIGFPEGRATTKTTASDF
jgi:hypothetical protein